jgi:energy-coupling factor transporter ATP-binding protein EcfA2
MLALPCPERRSSIDVLRDLIHVEDDDDWYLLVGFLLGALRAKGPYPVLALDGEHGSGKSTTVKMLRDLIDPAKGDLRAEPREIRDLMAAANHAHVIALDNVSRLQPWLSDALCRLSTGGALSTRALYTDDEEHVIEAVRPCILNGISSVITRGDLQDRAIPITMPVIHDADRRSEDDLWDTYARLWPGMLGGLLDGVSTALRRESSVTLHGLPRMADWAIWVTAGESSVGWPDETIVSAYRTRMQIAVEAALDGDALAQAIRTLTLPWTGTSSELLKQLTPADRPRGWPETPRSLSNALARLAPLFRRVGINVTLPKGARTARERQIVIEATETRGARQDRQDRQDANVSDVSYLSCCAPIVSSDDEGHF